jgi:hypothetical protein
MCGCRRYFGVPMSVLIAEERRQQPRRRHAPAHVRRLCRAGNRDRVTAPNKGANDTYILRLSSQSS